MDNLIDELRNFRVKTKDAEWSPVECVKAADEIERLRAENSTLRKMQPVELSGESARSFELALEVSRLQADNAEMEKQLNEFSEFLCCMTGNLLSKTNYTAKAMIEAAENYQQDVCDNVCDCNAELARVTAERDAAVEELENYMVQDVVDGNEPCGICAKASNIPCECCDPKWRGIKED